MLCLASEDSLDGADPNDQSVVAGGLPALCRSLARAFARPGGSIDLSLRELAVLLVTVQHPGQDLAGLAAATGLGRPGVRRAVDILRRAGLLTGQAGTAGEALAVVPTPPGETVVRDMVRGMTEDARPRAGASPDPVRAPGMSGFEPPRFPASRPPQRRESRG
jgi:DNA-binding MarR family transcriptional regulator